MVMIQCFLSVKSSFKRMLKFMIDNLGVNVCVFAVTSKCNHIIMS